MAYVDNADVTRIYPSTQDLFKPGDKTRLGDAEFIFIKYNDGDGTVTGVAGGLVYAVGTATTGQTAYEATMDVSSSTIVAIPQAPLGVLQAALTDGAYGWAQFKGLGLQDITTDGGVAVGERLMPHASTDGGFDTHSAGAVADVGVALEADSSTTLAAGKYILQIPL